MSNDLTERPTETVVCHCFSVTESEIQQTIAKIGADSVADVVRVTCAGSGCTACHCRIRQLLRKVPAAVEFWRH